MRLIRSILGRLAAGLAVVLGVSAVLFWALTILPSDPAVHILGMNATPERVASLRVQLGLDRPPAQRYLSWLWGAIQGDFGASLLSSASVSEVIGPGVVNTLLLAGTAGLVMGVLAYSTGILAGLRPGSRRDRWLSSGGLVGFSVPDFILAGVLLAVFGFALRWLPPTSILGGDIRPWQAPQALVLPVLALALPTASFVFRYVRAGVASAAGSDHVEAARLAGLSPVRVVIRHLLPGAIGPSLQAFGYAGAGLLGGTVVVERVFSYPGAGLALVDAVISRDSPVVLAIGVLLSAAVVVAFILADIVGLVVDPRAGRRRVP